MSLTFDLFRQFRSSKNKKSNLSSSKRSLRMEPLEDRALLAVSWVEYGEIRDAYPDLNLPAVAEGDWNTSASAINVIEIGNIIEDGEDNPDFAFGRAGLGDAIDAAMDSSKPDLIVVRTSATQNEIKLGGNELTIGGTGHLNAGSIAIVGWNVATASDNDSLYPLTLNAEGKSRVMSILEGANVGLANMTIANGNVNENGGGIFLKSDYSTGSLTGANATLVSVTLDHNTAANGGGFYQQRAGNTVSSKFVNVLFVENTATAQGGGMSFTGNGTNDNQYNQNKAEFINCTFVMNISAGGATSDSGGAGLHAIGGNNVSITNSVFWGNKTNNGQNADIILTSGKKAISYSLWGSGAVLGAGAGNLTAGTDPGFVGANELGLNPYSLSPSSPLINVGSNGNTAAKSFDLAGNSRIYGGTVDIGAFEIQQDQYIARNDGSAQAPIIIDLKTTAPTEITIPEGYGIWSGFAVQAFELNVLGNDTYTAGMPPYIEIVNNIDGDPMTNGMVFVANGKLYYAWGLGIGDVYSFTYKIGASEGSPMSNEATVTFKVDYAGPILVSTLQDETDYDFTNGDLSLREAIFLANRIGVDSIGVAEGLIDLNDTIPGANTIVLSHATGFGAIVLDSDLTITAPGLVIDAGNESRIFVIQGAANELTNVTLVGMTLTNGNAMVYTDVSDQSGGAILTENANLTLTDVTIENSTALCGGGVYLLNSTGNFNNVDFVNNHTPREFTGYVMGGGGLYAYKSSVAMIGGSFQKNTAYSDGGAFGDQASTDDVLTYSFDSVVFDENATGSNGGAIGAAFGNLSITNSQFLGNGAEDNGGAVYYTGKKLDISNSLFAQNTAERSGGALLVGNMAATTINNATIVDNEAGMDGGGISFSGTVTMNNSIVAKNTAVDRGMDIYPGLSTAIITGVNNLIGQRNAGQYDFGFVNGRDGNWIGTQNAPLDPRLDSNYVPTQFSLAVDNGNDEMASEDRAKQGNHVDIGAFESAFTASGNEIIWVTAANDNNQDPDLLSLRQALDLAAQRPGHDVIFFAEGVTGTIFLTEQLVANSNVSIYGSGSDLITLDANGESRILYTTASNVYISGMTLKNGENRTSNINGVRNVGGAIYAYYSTLTLYNLVVENCDNAVYAFGNSLLVTDSSFIGNTGTYGSSVMFFGDKVSKTATFQNVLFDNNVASGYGAAIYHHDSSYGTVIVENSEFTNNRSVTGGSIYQVGNGNLVVKDSSFENNSATSNQGGAIYVGKSGTAAISNSSFTDNKAASHGGAIAAECKKLEIYESTFQDNNASQYGGAVYTSYVGTCVVEGSFFSANGAKQGGAIYSKFGTMAVSDTVFASNNATYGGAVLRLGTNVNNIVTFDNVIFHNNQASANGGAVYQHDSSAETLRFTNTRFTDNKAGTAASFFQANGVAEMIDCTFANNFAWDATAAFKVANAKLTVKIRDEFFQEYATGNNMRFNDGDPGFELFVEDGNI